MPAYAAWSGRCGCMAMLPWSCRDSRPTSSRDRSASRATSASRVSTRTSMGSGRSSQPTQLRSDRPAARRRRSGIGRESISCHARAVAVELSGLNGREDRCQERKEDDHRGEHKVVLFERAHVYLPFALFLPVWLLPDEPPFL